MPGPLSCSEPFRSCRETPPRPSPHASSSKSTRRIRRRSRSCWVAGGKWTAAVLLNRRLAPNCDDRDLWWAVDANRHVDGPDPAAHEDRRVLAATGALQDRKPRLGQCAEAGNHDLPAVGVSRQDDGNVERGSFSQPAWIVRE